MGRQNNILYLHKILHIVHNTNQTMIKIAITLIIALQIPGCSIKKNNLTIKDFTYKYQDSLSRNFSDAKFEMVDDSTIAVKFNGQDISIYSDNAFREYKLTPDSLAPILHKYIVVASELFKPKSDVSIDNIVPIIKPTAFIENSNALLQTKNDSTKNEGAYDTYNEELVIAYAEDAKNTIRYLTNKDISALGINRDSLRIIATRNLDKLLTNIQLKGDSDVSMLTAGGNYEASLILLPSIINKKNLAVDGDFVIAIPNRDLLLVTGSNNKKGIARPKEIAADSYANGDHQVSEYLYKWNGSKFQKFN
ncbi:DUF1444 family protein [Ferruginibacter sp.]